MRRFERINEIPLTYYAEVPVEIEVYGDYHTIARFFDELSKMKRIVYVQDVSIGDPDFQSEDDSPKITVTGHAVTFRFLSEAELEERDGGKKKKGKKGGRKGGKKGG